MHSCCRQGGRRSPDLAKGSEEETTRPRTSCPARGLSRSCCRAVYHREDLMSNAWIYQDDKQVKERGAEAASWYVGWYNPEGKRRCKSCGPGENGHRNAQKLRRKIESELMCG